MKRADEARALKELIFDREETHSRNNKTSTSIKYHRVVSAMKKTTDKPPRDSGVPRDEVCEWE